MAPMQRVYHGRWLNTAGEIIQHYATSDPRTAAELWPAIGMPGTTLTVTQNWTTTVSAPEEPAVFE